MSPRTTESGVVDALIVLEALLESLDVETCARCDDVFDTAFDAANALNGCALSSHVHARFLYIIQKASSRCDAAVKLLRKQRQEALDRERELEAALEKERQNRERDQERKREGKVALVVASWLAFGFVPAYWDDFRLLPILIVPAMLHYLLFSDSKPAQWLRDLLKLN